MQSVIAQLAPADSVVIPKSLRTGNAGVYKFPISELPK